MLQISADFLALTSEAAVLVHRGKISFANSAARAVLGEGCLGKSVGAVFGTDIACTQASSFIGEVPIQGVYYIVRVTKIDNMESIFFSRPETKLDLLSDAFVYSFRSSLMSLGISMEVSRVRAEENGDKEMLAQVAEMSRNYYKLHRIISNAAVIRGMDDGTLYFGVQRFDLRYMLQRLVDTLGVLADVPELRMAPGGPVYVSADPALIEQLMLNLLSNCFTHAIGCTRVSINLIDCVDRVMISVDDDGCGIPADKLHGVFDRFRHGYEMSAMGCGAGFGLTVVRAIAQLHGGALLLESREGRGTTARVSIGKTIADTGKLSSGGLEYEPNMSDILIGMADCLPSEKFSERFSD